MDNSTWWVNAEQLDEEQKNIVSLPIEKNYLVVGAPGSGKTNLLLLRANYLAKSGFPNILLLVFTRTLREYIVSGASQYSFSSDKIMTSHSWMLDLVRQYDKQITLGNNFLENRLVLLREAEKIVEENDISNLYEAILLDEAQDYLPEEINFFRQVSNKIFAVADKNQKIYDGEDPLAQLNSIVDNTYELRRHYRNGLRICQLADGLIKTSKSQISLASTSNYNEEKSPSSVNIFRCKTLEEQCNLIFRRVNTQLKAFPNEFIGIISPLRKDVRIIGEFFNNSLLADKIYIQSAEDDFIPLNTGCPIIISTLHSSKGLEFRALHIASFECIKKFKKQKKLAFMSVTRVKTSLSIYHSGFLPGYFEQADTNMRRPPNMAKIEDLFGEIEEE